MKQALAGRRSALAGRIPRQGTVSFPSVSPLSSSPDTASWKLGRPSQHNGCHPKESFGYQDYEVSVGNWHAHRWIWIEQRAAHRAGEGDGTFTAPYRPHHAAWRWWSASRAELNSPAIRPGDGPAGCQPTPCWAIAALTIRGPFCSVACFWKGGRQVAASLHV